MTQVETDAVPIDRNPQDMPVLGTDTSHKLAEIAWCSHCTLIVPRIPVRAWPGIEHSNL
jgi:hypothetical protein